ncbi:MAG: YicC family protein [Magnetococcales bacterium]|nr:YicC family protein [Magnetococcales bacterium]
MARGMTGFAKGERVIAGWRVRWRIKSVNHRHLDLSVRLPDGFSELELLVVRLLQQRFARGHLECTLSLDAEGGGARRLQLDRALLAAVQALEREVLAGEEGVVRTPFTMDRLMAWPGMVHERVVGDELSGDAGCNALLEFLDEVCGQLAAARQAEGLALVAVIERILMDLRGCLDQVEAQIPRVRTALEQRVQERVATYIGKPPEMDEGLARELAYLFTRQDIAEELDRLRVHVREMGSLLMHESPIGLRLDFLCQELNREANTLCSKAQDGPLARLGVEIKVYVEQLREQARNLE